MNLLKTLIDDPKMKIQEAALFSRKPKIFSGLCFNCDNRGHCVWQENKKLKCEHFE